MTYLADAQHRAGAVRDALETVEQALDYNPEEAVERPETLRIRGELRLSKGIYIWPRPTSAARLLWLAAWVRKPGNCARR
jgi:hypothetical protein